MKYKIYKNIAILSLLATGSCSQAWAECPEGQVLGVNSHTCIQATRSCGSGCTYTVDEQGTLTVNSSGSVGYSRWDTSDVTKFVLNDSTGVVTYFNLSLIDNKPNLHEVILPNNIQVLHGSTAESTGGGFNTFIVPESVVSRVGGGDFHSNSSITTYCTTSQINTGVCTSNVTRYERDGENLIVYNSDNTIKGIYSDYTGITRDQVVDSYEKTDENGNVLKYDGRGNLDSISKYDSGGNLIARYDENGFATYKRTSYTPAEAAAAANRGDKNTIKFTFK